jgi:hypothetical protein
MNCTNRWEGSAAASAVITHEITSPNCAGSVPSGPCRPVTMAVLLARNVGSLAHSGQVGLASLRSPASSSSRYVDQIAIADWPAK